MNVTTINANHKAQIAASKVGNGATQGSALDLGAYKLGSVHIPSVFTGTVFALETNDGGSWQPINTDSGTVVSLTVAPGQSYAFDSFAAAIAGCRVIRPVVAAQASDVEIKFTLKA